MPLREWKCLKKGWTFPHPPVKAACRASTIAIEGEESTLKRSPNRLRFGLQIIPCSTWHFALLLRKTLRIPLRSHSRKGTPYRRILVYRRILSENQCVVRLTSSRGVPWYKMILPVFSRQQEACNTGGLFWNLYDIPLHPHSEIPFQIYKWIEVAILQRMQRLHRKVPLETVKVDGYGEQSVSAWYGN